MNFCRFFLRRLEDVSGCSGTGAVAQGVQFSDGTCALRWASGCAGASSTGVYGSIDDVVRIHGHEGATVVEWHDMPVTAEP